MRGGGGGYTIAWRRGQEDFFIWVSFVMGGGGEQGWLAGLGWEWMDGWDGAFNFALDHRRILSRCRALPSVEQPQQHACI